MVFEDVTVAVEGSTGVISIARPKYSNAVRPKTLDELSEALDLLERDTEVRAILLRAEGRHFCAGATLDFLSDLSELSPAVIQKEIYSHFLGAARRIYHCPKPTVACVAGAAVTVGCELALACDFRIAAPNAKFQESWIKIGLMPPLGGLFLLPRIIGLGRACEVFLRGEPLRAQDALQLGLASEIVPLDELDGRARALARELAGLPPLAYAAIKNALHRGLESTMEAEWSANVASQAVLLSTNDFQAGLQAIKGSGPAVFSGT